MGIENPESGLEDKGLWFNPERIFEMWEFKGLPDHPEITEAEAKDHVTKYITVGDNEYASDDDLRKFGFERRETPTETA